jgi:hypothetical protein
MGFFHCTGPRQSDNRAAMKLIPALIPVCALLLTGAVKAESFEGKLTMTITNADSKNPAQPIDFSLKEGYMRTDINTGKNTASMIFDMKNQQMIILIPQMQKYMVQSMAQNQTSGQPPASGMPSSASNGNGASFQDTGTKESILGYECEKYLITGKNETSEIWLTSDLGSFMGFYHGGGPGGRGSPQAQQWESVLKGKNFFPMRVLTRTSKGLTKMEVTAVEKKSLPDSLFAPPDGWQKFDMGGMMSGLGGMFGGRPQSGNN